MNTAYFVLFNAVERNCTQSKLISENYLFVLPFCLLTRLTNYLIATHMAIKLKGQNCCSNVNQIFICLKKIITDLGEKR